jgi:FtsZ-binding cell division protein ZapB
MRNKTKKRNIRGGNDECPICHENLSINELLFTHKLCKNIFHKNCIKKWCDKLYEEDRKCSCPLCRKTINPVEYDLEREYDKLVEENDKLEEENDKLVEEYNELVKKNNKLVEENKNLTKEYNELVEENDELVKENEDTDNKYNVLHNKYNELVGKYNGFILPKVAEPKL